eukprot:gene21183-7988_t
MLWYYLIAPVIISGCLPDDNECPSIGKTIPSSRMQGFTLNALHTDMWAVEDVLGFDHPFVCPGSRYVKARIFGLCCFDRLFRKQQLVLTINTGADADPMVSDAMRCHACWPSRCTAGLWSMDLHQPHSQLDA